MRSRSAESRLLLVVSVAVFLDTLFYAVITPLLPQLTHRAASLEAHRRPADRELPGRHAGGLAAGRCARRATRSALHADHGHRAYWWSRRSPLACSTPLRRWASPDSSKALAARARGPGAWRGSFRRHRRTAAARSSGRRSVPRSQAPCSARRSAHWPPSPAGAVLFCALAAVTSLLSDPDQSDFRTNTSPRTSRSPTSCACYASPALAGAMWLMVLPAIVSGVFNVLGPLQLHALGAGAGVIGFTFLAGRRHRGHDLTDRRPFLRPSRPDAAAARGARRDRDWVGLLHAAIDRCCAVCPDDRHVLDARGLLGAGDGTGRRRGRGATGSIRRTRRR